MYETDSYHHSGKFAVLSFSAVQPKQAAERITYLLATLSPEVNAELSMLLDVLLQEKVEAVLACQLAQPHTVCTLPMATTLGIKAILEGRKKGSQGRKEGTKGRKEVK